MGSKISLLSYFYIEKSKSEEKLAHIHISKIKIP